MGKAAAARKLAAAAAFGGGGLSVLGAGLYGVLRAEAMVARRVIGEPADNTTLDSSGWYGSGRSGEPLRLAVLGDSSAAGYGVERVEQTPGARLASGVAHGADRRVHLREIAWVGARSSDLARQVDLALAADPEPLDLTVILVGANDVTHRVRPSESVRDLSVTVTRLIEGGSQVLVGTCPDLGTIKPIPPPLKQVARAWSRRLAAAQAIATVDAGGISVALASILGPDFEAAPAVLFGPDRFHPSVEGYRALADVLIPSALNALGVGEQPLRVRSEITLPVAAAAVRASRTPGSELGDKKGLWVELRRRARRPHSDPEAPRGADDEVAGQTSSESLSDA